MADYLYEAKRGSFDVFTALAEEVISAGWLVKSTSAVDAVTSQGMTSLAKDDIKVMACNAAGDDQLVVGITLQDAASGSYCSVATKGLYIMRSSGAIASGIPINANESDPAEVNGVDNGQEEYQIGKCVIGTGGDNSYALVSLNV
jgi:hypothetical protein